MRDCGRIPAGFTGSGQLTTETELYSIRAREKALQGPALPAHICRIRAGTILVPQMRKFQQAIWFWKPFPVYQNHEYFYINCGGENIRLNGGDHL